MRASRFSLELKSWSTTSSSYRMFRVGKYFSKRAPHDSDWSLGRFRLYVLPSAVYNPLGAEVPPTFQAAGRLRKGRSGFGFRVGSLEECVLLSVCEAHSRYS